MPPSAYAALGIVEDPPDEFPPLELAVPPPLLLVPAPLLEDVLPNVLSPPVLGLVLLLQPAAQTHAIRVKLAPVIAAFAVLMKASYRRSGARTP
jgi:hypothetical protein